MSKVVNFNGSEIASPEHFTQIGTFARQAADAIVGGALGWPAHWARITVSQKPGFADVVTISPGEYHATERVYAAEEPVDINLQVYKPVLVSDEHWVALILRGNDETLAESVAIETSEEPLVTSIPVQMAQPKIFARSVSVVVQQGVVAPAPALRPVPNENDCCIAFVRLKTTGVVEVVANEAGRVKTAFVIEGRLTAVEVQIETIFQDIATIQTVIGNLAASLEDVPDPRLIRQVVRDTARHAQRLNLPDEARNYFYDNALLPDFWAFDQGGYFRINEGIWFQYVAQKEAVLRALNMDAGDISVYDNRLLMPKYTEVTRITAPLGSGRKDIANTVHTITTAVKIKKSHTRIRYGETIRVCENAAGWNDVLERKPNEIFAVNGQEFVSRGIDSDPWNNNPESEGHKSVAVQRVIKDTVRRTYIRYDSEEIGLAGAIYGQTFLVSQVMVATSIDLYFTRVGSTGDVIFCLCEITPSGTPDFQSVLETYTMPVEDIALGWVKFEFEPTYLENKRYAWFTVTTGNHQIAMTTMFQGGTSFTCTDGAWAQGSLTEDFSFRLNAARFESSRVVVPFESVTLTGGITEIHMVYQGWEPAATRLVWEVKAEGDIEWIPLDARVDNPLGNLPPQVQLRAVLIGTEDLAPAILLDSNAWVMTGRMRPDMRAISKEMTFGFGTDAGQIVLQMDNYDEAHHSVDPKVIVGGSVINPVSVTPEQDPARPSRWKITANFDLPVNTTSARLRIDATTDDVTFVPFGQDVQFNAFNAV